jgi:hypothetical protein
VDSFLLGGGAVSDIGIPEVGGYTLGGAALVKFAIDYFTSRAKKADELEEENRAEEVADIKRVLEAVTEIRSDMALFKQALATTNGAFVEMKERVDGISENYGGRIARLEQDLTSLSTKVETLLQIFERKGRK